MSDDDDESLHEEEKGLVQLGFVEPGKTNELFNNRVAWEDWDGGKVGGIPIWLDPENLPRSDCLQCRHCENQMTFLLQIYCPLDEPETAFHRSLYVFVCKRSSCLKLGSLKCLKCQISRANPYYPYNSNSITSVIESTAKAPSCAVCGCRGDLRCGRCKLVNYCCKSHQKVHWSKHKTRCCHEVVSVVEDREHKLLFPEYSLEVSEEDLSSDAKPMSDLEAMSAPNVWEGAVMSDEEDEDADLSQDDYNSALGNAKSDAVYERFLTRVQKNPDQILRYSRWPSPDEIRAGAGPLAITSSARAAAQSTDPSMTCPRCGAPRAFEFQVMPQLLHYLHVDKSTKVVKAEQSSALSSTPADHENLTEASVKPEHSVKPATEPAAVSAAASTAEPTVAAPGEAPKQQLTLVNKKDEDLDWGTLDIYTCTASCDGTCRIAEGGSSVWGSYVEELVVFRAPSGL